VRQGGSIIHEKDRLPSRHSGRAFGPESMVLIFQKQKTLDPGLKLAGVTLVTCDPGR
jgi:hypothetical protein